MKVASIEAIPLGYPEPNDFGATRYVCLAKVTSDDGLVGWGESITQYPEATRATQAIIDGLAEAVVLGSDPLNLAAVWRAMKEHAWWYGYGGGIASYAIAAIDMALWDLKGRTLGVSVLELMGGAAHERLPAIASCHAQHESIPEMAEEAAQWLSSGLQGVKVGFGKRGNARLGFDHDRDVAYVRAVRGAIGSDALLMVDLGIAIKWEVPTAIRRTRAFEEHGLAWIEEPLGAWNPSGYDRLRSLTTTAIAYGEKEWDLRGYERILATGTVDVVGIDPARAEGITGFRKVADMVEIHGRHVNAHAWSTAISTAASVALSFSTPASLLIELKPLLNPVQHELVANPIAHTEGWITPLTGPGLGIEVVEEVVQRYRLDRPVC